MEEVSAKSSGCNILASARECSIVIPVHLDNVSTKCHCCLTLSSLPEHAVKPTPDSLFGAPITWSRGAKVSATMLGAPTGNDLLLFGNKSYLKKGERSQPESLVDSARAQDSVDDTAVKFRVRRAFQLAHERAFSIVERITD